MVLTLQFCADLCHISVHTAHFCTHNHRSGVHKGKAMYNVFREGHHPCVHRLEHWFISDFQPVQSFENAMFQVSTTLWRSSSGKEDSQRLIKCCISTLYHCRLQVQYIPVPM